MALAYIVEMLKRLHEESSQEKLENTKSAVTVAAGGPVYKGETRHFDTKTLLFIVVVVIVVVVVEWEDVVVEEDAVVEEDVVVEEVVVIEDDVVVVEDVDVTVIVVVVVEWEDVVVEEDAVVEEDVVVEEVVVVQDDVVVVEDVDVTADSASGLLPSDFKTSPIGKIIAHVIPPNSTNKNATKIKIRFFDHHDVFTIIGTGSSYSISL